MESQHYFLIVDCKTTQFSPGQLNYREHIHRHEVCQLVPPREAGATEEIIALTLGEQPLLLKPALFRSVAGMMNYQVLLAGVFDFNNRLMTQESRLRRKKKAEHLWV